MIQNIILPALLDTLYMVVSSTILAVILGFVLAIILVVTSPKGLNPNKLLYNILDFIINILRSMPFLILMISIAPFTKFIVGKSIGTNAAIIPLTIGAMPFAARVIESSLNEVDYGIIEAAKSFGSSNMQIIFKVMVKEALPSIVSGITLTVINVIGYSAMAGSIGAGGLGDVAVRYGYHRFKADVMIITVIILIILVQLIQALGNILYKRLIT
ncbi:methionine ABC transporter permease [Clostridium algidicarnis]|uniref:methionine ABC transporter permease n=1 Tax=Clostridium algidicarnis TaxID=37659 RepID=UPI001C0D1990|nr:methionine ABC transporter permease [Clostridium algidicarnis]MBU3210248.1 ABC transporter permease [Clostridium algidicarnis]MBU3228681.1 ABC transporter permease [Clostridium algidicarnis]MBU3251273.1 ABC transporter permease [Clostridium algidicarnis]